MLLTLKGDISDRKSHPRDERSPGAWDLPPEVSTVKSRMLSLTLFCVSIGRIAGMLTITLHMALPSYPLCLAPPVIIEIMVF